jgi:hypothetical protein
MNIFQVVICVLRLNKVLPLQDDISVKAAIILYDAKLYNECIFEIKNRMHISCILRVAHNNQCFNKKNALAEIFFDTEIPNYGTREFKQYVVKMIVSLQLRTLPSSVYIRSIAHEMAHVVLYSIQSQYKESEIATDIATMILGFSQPLKESRCYCGYLKGTNFWTAYILIKILQFKKNIPTRIISYINSVRLRNNKIRP